MADEMYRNVDAAGLERLVADLFLHAGLSTADAAFMGECLVDADLRGVHSHGTRWAPRYVASIKAGHLNPNAKATVVVDRGATAIVDGDRGVGHIAVKFAMEVAIAKAKQFGNGTVGVRNNSHCGAVAYYAQQAADAGCIGFAATTGGTMIAPWGGLDRRVGLNPISWAAPTGLGFSYNLDMAPSIVAGSKIEMARDRGEAIPADWGYDADGNPTTNPSDIMPGGGTLAGVGGYKGVGLGVGADILCSILPGGRYHEGQDPTVGGGMIVQAIDIEHFQPLAEFTGRMDRMVAYYKSGRKRPGVDDVYLPGELELGRAHARVSAGIPLDQPTRASLRSAAEDAGIGYTIELPSHS